MVRPYLSCSVQQLKDLASGATSQIREAVIHELSFRKSRAAKALLRELLGHAPQGATEGDGRPGEGKTKRADFALTDEQRQAVDLFLTRKTLRITAFAGAGKTSTLVAMSRSDSRSGLYLAFNRSIAVEARQKFSATVDCRTTHSLAFHAVRGAFKNVSKLADSVNINAIADLLSLQPYRLPKLQLSRSSYASLVKRTVLRYCQSCDRDIRPSHVPVTGKLALLEGDELQQLLYAVTAYARTLWLKMIDPNDPTPMGHDGYLKLWALSDPVILRDYILVDEAQDTNHVVLDVFKRQKAQLIFVGDTHQQIYEWRGAINAMEQIETDHRCQLTMSFRFGEAIAQAANCILKALKEPTLLRGNPGRNSTLGTIEYDAVLCRTNGVLISELIKLLAHGRRVHVVGGVDEVLRLLYGVVNLQNNTPSDVPEFFGFSNWNEVVRAVKADELPELTTFVNLVEKYSVQKLISAVRETESTAATAEVELSTAHKAKGREWNRVRLTDDFLIAQASKIDAQRKFIAKEEIRIAYVAVTRAIEAVYIPPGIRNAFSIHQDPRFDAIHQRESAMPSDFPVKDESRRENARQPLAQPIQPNWLDRIRSWFQ